MEKETKLHKILNERKPKTAKGRRILRERAPKLHENPKKSITLRGLKSTPEILQLLEELHGLRMPLDTLYAKKHEIHPFENGEAIEKMCTKLDSSLFAMGSKSKKRPFRLVFGRLFDSKILDMQEFKVSNYMNSRKFSAKELPMLGSKPLVIFQGAAFEQHPKLAHCKGLLLDFFRGGTADNLNLQHIDHAIVLTTLDSTSENCPAINFRHYHLQFMRSAEKLPRVQLNEIGPRFDMTLDREKAADPTIFKLAHKVPKEVKKKNVKTDTLGRTRGRLHLGKQDFEGIHTIHGRKRSSVSDTIRGKKRSSSGVEPKIKKKKRLETKPETKPVAEA